MTPELQKVEDQIQHQQWSKWLHYERLTLGMTDDSQKLVIARKVAAMPGFGVTQCWIENLYEKQRNPRKSELELLVDQLRKEPTRWLCFRRRSLGMKSERERIEVARECLAMPEITRAREKFERNWCARQGFKDAADDTAAH